MKKILFTICISIFFAASSLAQIDNGTNYISDSKTKKIATKSQCDQIFKKNGDVISALIKDTFADIIKYKTCKDYITNATVSGAIVTLPTYEIDKIVFSNQLTKFYNVKRPITRSRNEKLKNQNVKPNENSKRNFRSPFMKQKSLTVASLTKPTPNNKLKGNNYVISGLDYRSYYDYYSFGFQFYDEIVINNQFLKYISLKNKTGYYVSLYTDYGQSQGFFGTTTGACYSINNTFKVYLGGGIEFSWVEAQIETGLIINIRNIPFDIGYRINASDNNWSGFRFGTGYRF